LIEIDPIVDNAGADELKVGFWKIPDVLFSTCESSRLPPFRALLATLVLLVLVLKFALVTVDGVSRGSVSDIGAVVNVVEKREMLASSASGGKKGAGESDGSDEVDDDGPLPEECDPCR
jgi:hypothetical protein